MAAKSRRSKPLQWRIECLAHAVTEFLASILPGAWIFRIGEWLGALAWHLFPDRRRTVIRNLRIAYAGEMSLDEIHRMARESFRRTGANLISSTHTATLSPGQLRKSLVLENIGLLEEARASGRGVVLLLAHMGNWEVLSRLIHFFPPGSRAGAMYRPLNNPLLDRRILARREKDGTRMFSKRDPFHQITGFLREGGIVGVLADQRVGKQGDAIRFFDRATRASPLPCLLARRAHSTVLALSLITERPGKWRAVLSAVATPGTTAGCMAALEIAMKSSPLDVFWMQDRWKIKPRAKYPPEAWVGSPTPHADKKPLRALLWLAGDLAPRELPQPWRHPSVTYEVVLSPGQSMPSGFDAGTPVHRIHPSSVPRELHQAIEKIDQASIIPLDFIITFTHCKPLARAAHDLGLAVARLT